MSNQSQGAVLAGQPVAVTAGSGITIDPNTGVISVNASTITGVMKLNNGSAYNAYQWPNSPGTNGQFLQTNGAGLVDWADVQGFAVVSVQSGAPSPADIGELWFDCDTGTLNVYQNCVGTPSPNWFNVAQPGFPVLPANTSSDVAWTGSGTQASPYQMTVTTTGSGSAVQILNTVTINGLSPFQYVPIVDLNAVANGGRFSFTNNYADSSGQLIFNTVFTDLPPSGSGIIYNAAIKVGYGSVYIDAQVTVVAALVVTGGSIAGPLYVGQQLTYTPGVPSGGSTPYGSPTIKWFANGNLIGGATAPTFTLTGAQLNAQITASTTYTDASAQTATGTSAAVGPVLANPGTLTITSPGSISPSTNVSVGTTLNYTAGTFTGGIPTVTPSWVWQRAGTNITGTANATSYPTVSADANQAITVRYTVTDSATPVAATASQSTAAVTPFNPIPSPVWSPNPPLNSTAEAISSGAWNGTVPQTITASGCVEVSLNGTSFSPSVNITTAGATLYQRWKPSCVGQKSGDTITGSVDAGSQGKNDYSIQLDHLPTNAYNNLTATGVALGADVVGTATSALAGVNAPAYVTIASSGNTGTNIQASTVSATGPWTTLPTTGTTFPLLTGQNLYIKQTVGSSTSTPYVANIQVGDDPAIVGATFSSFSFTATTTGSAAFPGLTFDNGGAPNAAPDTVSGVAGGGSLGTLNGVANSNSWPTGFGTSLSSPVSGANPTMKFRVNGSGSYVSSALSVVPTDVLNLAWNEAYLATVADGTNATGTITGTVSGTAYTNSFTLAVKRSADWSVPSPAVINAATNTQQTTGPRTVNNFNVPVTVSFAAPTTGTSPQPMTTGTIFAKVGGGTNVPITLGSTTVTLNPGQTLEVLGDTGGTGGATYGVKITVGTSAAQDWLVTTTAATNAITAPTMSPTGTGLNPALNSPAGITLGGGNYAIASGSPGSHTGSDWQLIQGSATPIVSTNTITGTGTGASAWGLVPSGTTVTLDDVTYGNSKYVVVGSSGTVLTSSDGLTWASQPRITTATLQGVTFGNSTFVAVGTGGVIFTSPDGTTWTPRTSGITTNLLGVKFFNSLFVAVGNNGRILTSPNGTTWTSQTSGTTQILYDVAFGNSTFVVVGGNGTILTSPNGTTWTSQTSGVTSNLNAVAFGSSTFVAVVNFPISPTNANLLTSPDGIIWTTQDLGGTSVGTLNGIAFGGSQFVLSGSFLYTSPNGTTWTQQTSNTSGMGGGIGYGPPRFVIVGTAGRILTQAPTSALTISGANTDGFAVGNIISNGLTGASAASGSITSVDGTTVTVLPQSANWGNGQNLYLGLTVVNVVNDGTNLVTYPVAQSLLTTSTTYYSRARYRASSTSTVSPWASWASFSTSAAFAPNPGTPMGGGYYAGQILGAGGTSGAGGLDNSGTIYNLIVAPVGPVTQGANTLYGQNGGSTPTGIQYKTSNTANGNANAKNLNFGALCTDELKSNALFPVFNTFINGATGPNAGAFNLTTGGSGTGTGIGGYNNWYLPARNELAVLYFFLKPSTTANVTTWGSNSNSVSPYTPNSNYGPGFPNQTTANGTGGTENFQTGNTQAFATTTPYWSSTEDVAPGDDGAWPQFFSNGNGNTFYLKISNYYARAVRRVAA